MRGRKNPFGKGRNKIKVLGKGDFHLEKNVILGMLIL
jgi:hypothetical protein